MTEAARNPEWPTLRRKFLVGKVCAVCGGKKKLEAHHILPFHLFPAREMDETNLVPLCEAKKDGINCHLLFGHLGSFESYNPSVLVDADAWKNKIANRPKGDKP